MSFRYENGTRSMDSNALQIALVLIDKTGHVTILKYEYEDQKCVLRVPCRLPMSFKESFLVVANTSVGADRGNHDLDLITIELSRSAIGQSVL